MKKIEFFKVEGEQINRIRRHCPKCGPAVFLAKHKNRFSCGKCGYTEFRSGGKKEPKRTQDIIEETKEKETEKEIESSDDFSNLESTESNKPIEKEPEEKDIKDENKKDEPEKTM